MQPGMCASMSFRSFTFLATQSVSCIRNARNQRKTLQKKTAEKLRPVIVHRNCKHLPVRLVIINHCDDTEDPHGCSWLQNLCGIYKSARDQRPKKGASRPWLFTRVIEPTGRCRVPSSITSIGSSATLRLVESRLQSSQAKGRALSPGNPVSSLTCFGSSQVCGKAP